MTSIQKITPNLWFNNQAEEAVEFYSLVFKNAKTGRITRYGNEGQDVHGMPAGTVMTIEFWLEGQQFIALNGGPVFKFNEAISLVVNCDTQEDVDYYWDKLGEGGDEDARQCGWLKDKFGLSWQIVPTILPEMLSDTNSEKTDRVMKAMLKMKKLYIAALQQAFEEKPVELETTASV